MFLVTIASGRRSGEPNYRTKVAERMIGLREARVGDAASLASLLTELGYPTSEQQASARLAKLHAEPETRVLVAEDVGGELVGLAGVRAENLLEHDRPAARLIALVVAESHRRHGIARMLVDAAEAEARARGCSRIVLTSADRRDDAHAFYVAAGYEQTGRRFAKELSPEP